MAGQGEGEDLDDRSEPASYEECTTGLIAPGHLRLPGAGIRQIGQGRVQPCPHVTSLPCWGNIHDDKEPSRMNRALEQRSSPNHGVICTGHQGQTDQM